MVEGHTTTQKRVNNGSSIETIHYDRPFEEITSRGTYVIGKINNSKTKMLLDTGASVSLISLHKVKQLQLPITSKVKARIMVANNKEMDCPGMVVAEVRLGRIVEQFPIVVASELTCDFVLGIESCYRFSTT